MNTRQLSNLLFPASCIVPVAAGVRLEVGAQVVANAAGFAIAVGDDSGLDFPFVLGCCEKTVDNALGLAGAKSVLVREGVFGYGNEPGGLVTAAQVGGICYASAPGVVTSNPSLSYAVAGTVCSVDGETVYVSQGKVTGLALSAIQLIRPSYVSARIVEFDRTYLNGTSTVLNLATVAAGSVVLGVEIELGEAFVDHGVNKAELAIGTAADPGLLVVSADLTSLPVAGRPDSIVFGKSMLTRPSGSLIATVTANGNMANFVAGQCRVVIYTANLAGTETVTP